jgi:four helix bundle protein
VHGDFKKLRAYQLAREVARSVRAPTLRWSYLDQQTVGVQLIRAADSVGANIAEAMGRWHRGDQRRLLYIARGSLRETEHWILVAQERGLLPLEIALPLDELGRTLGGLINYRDGQ